MSDWGSRPNLWYVWTSRVTPSGELLIFAYRRSSFAQTLVSTLWKNGTLVVPVAAETELGVAEHASAIKSLFRTRATSNPYTVENPDTDANEDYEEQEARDRERAAQNASPA